MSNKKSTGVTAISSASLTYPSMSGSKVETTLGEMDALRASAANAIKIAQGLEAQQGLIRIEVVERYQYQESSLYTTMPRISRPIPSWEAEDSKFAHRLQEEEDQRRRAFEQSSWVERKRVLNISMVNLEEVMGELMKEANFRTEETHKAEVTSLEDLNNRCQQKLEKANEAHRKAEENVIQLTDTNKSIQREADGYSDTIDILVKKVKEYEKLQKLYTKLSQSYSELTVKYNDIVVKKTFWGWLQEKLA